VVEAPGGGEGFKHDGWSFEFDRGDEGNKFKLDETRASAALLLGRRTYEGFAEAWPSRTDDVGFADKFNSMPKYVVSTTLESADWNNTTILRSLDDVPKLKDDVEGELVVHGSPTLVQGLLEQDLVDELRLMVFPVVLGSGKRLWGETSDKKPFTLADAKTVGDGIAILTFRR
jgi:dihydrofolate reductase